MDDKDLVIQGLRREIARMANRAIEVASAMCFMCKEHRKDRNCKECSTRKLMEDLTK